MKKLLLTVVALLFCSSAVAQIPGNFDPGTVYGNSSAAARPGRVENFGAIINRQTEDTGPAWDTDFVPSYDASAATGKKLKLSTITREALLANRTYFVRTDGNDTTCNGLTSAAAASAPACAFLTINKAVDVTAALDLRTFAVTIQVVDGTYTTPVVLKSYVGVGPVTLQGNTSTPGNVVISTTSAAGITGTDAGTWAINGFKITTVTGASSFAILAAGPTTHLNVSKMEYGSVQAIQVVSSSFATITLLADYTVSGAATGHLFAINGGVIVAANALTATITGTPAFSTAFLQVLNFAEVSIGNITWSGAATGKKFDISNNSVAIGTTTLPGSTAGTQATGGQIDALGETPTTRVSTQYDNATTTLGNITGLATTVKAGLTYEFEAILYTTSNIAGGVKFAIAGTATATAIIYEAIAIDSAALTEPVQTRATALATAVISTTAVTVAYVRITGTITVNAAGTLTVQAAANAAVGTTSVLVGSVWKVNRVV